MTGADLVYAMSRDTEAARRWAAEALDLAERWNLPGPAGYAAVVLSWARAMNGDPGTAIPELRRQLAAVEVGGTQHLVAWGFGLLAEAHLRDGRPLEALHLLDDALARVARTGERSYESELHRLRGLSLLAADPPRRDEAREALRRAVVVAREQGSTLLERRAGETRAAAGLEGHSGSDSSSGPRP